MSTRYYNASHAAWRGAGRFFRSYQDAIDGYKTAAIKTAIRTAAEFIEASEVAA